MKFLNYSIGLVLALSMTSCSHNDKAKEKRKAGSTQVQTEADPAQLNAQRNAIAMTEGWPQSSTAAASEMILKHGDPSEKTDNSLIWRKVAPFEKIIVNREVHSSRFPLLHQNAVDHVVKYKVPPERVEDVRKFNGDIRIDSTKGEMTASGENESMNILKLNMANQVSTGKLSADEARIQLGKENLNFMNGQQTAYTQTLTFGQQINTSDKGQSMTKDIQWNEESKESQEDTKQGE